MQDLGIRKWKELPLELVKVSCNLQRDFTRITKLVTVYEIGKLLAIILIQKKMFNVGEI